MPQTSTPTPIRLARTEGSAIWDVLAAKLDGLGVSNGRLIVNKHEALKKVGIERHGPYSAASVIVSQPAFAFALPDVTVNPSLSYNGPVGTTRIRVSANAGSATCNTSSTGGPTPEFIFTGTQNTTGTSVENSGKVDIAPIVLNPTGSGGFQEAGGSSHSTRSAAATTLLATPSRTRSPTTWACTYAGSPTPTTDFGETSGTISFDGTTWTVTPLTKPRCFVLSR